MTSLLQNLTREGRWIPWLFVAFFLVIFTVNGIMVTVALSTWTGLTTQTHYRDGIEYNQRLAAVERQEALGWTVTLTSRTLDNGVLDFAVAVSGPEGRPLYPDRVAVAFVRPTTEGFDSRHELELRADGRYGVFVDLPLDGIWDARVTVEEHGRRHQSGQRLFVQQ